ncbi:MFS transporter [Picrophilus oshimae]|uniref:MFS transporter, SP family, inositol transporter n=1 Tax=Picrophilus torridus (strain ATCC 700027 / DSM 9790 / JCM 10055 / NBRC 100828 / KAW 2/3) TaxID=1122961 RepID=A0A8G2FXU1_PICTO|nr:MFS transporter [Picrophilus oshimae]SMD31418.1 MFS transporter, SP family, inositol transporter [Picrophilus oshimae DSM 9789]
MDSLENWDTAKLDKERYKWILSLGMADFLDAFLFVTAGVVITLLLIDFPHMSVVIEGFIPFSLSFGVFFGAFFGGRWGDKFGRKIIFMWDMALMAVAALIDGFSVNPIMFILVFFIAGIALGADVPTSWSMIAEFSPKKSRNFAIAIPYTMWVLAIPFVYTVDLAVTDLHAGVYSFRILMWIIAVIAFFVFLTRRQVIESPRWLLIKGHENEYTKLTKTYTKQKNTKDENKENNIETLTFSKFLKKGKFKKYFVLMIILYISWGLYASTFGTFTIFIFPGLGIKTLLDITIVEWVLEIIAISFELWWSRYNIKYSRNMAFTPIFAGAVVFVVVVAIASFLVNPILGFIGLVGFGTLSTMVSPIIRTWSVEMWPTEIRTTVQGQIWSYMRLASAVWLFAGPALLATVKDTGYLSIVIVFVVIVLIISTMLPNTNDKSLEEVRNMLELGTWKT